MIRKIGTLAAMLGLASLVGAFGYAFIGTVWKSKRIVMHLQLGATGGTLIDGSDSWDTVAETALAIWNTYIKDAKFYVVRDAPSLVGDGNGVNNVFFDSDVYGYSFAGAVAITTEWRNKGFRTEGDVIFNTAYDWNSYRGPLRAAFGGGTLYDLRRVALHEFGHILGLDHPDERGQFVAALMNSYVSNIDDLKPDDIAGAQALYGVPNGGSNLAEFTKPREKRSFTSARRKTFRGTAKARRVVAVYIRNNQIRGKYFKARGVAKWRRPVRLLPGTNRLTLYVDNGGRTLEKVDRVVVTRR